MKSKDIPVGWVEVEIFDFNKRQYRTMLANDGGVL